jgi:predicted MFS family arabinose efflux permease
MSKPPKGWPVGFARRTHWLLRRGASHAELALAPGRGSGSRSHHGVLERVHAGRDSVDVAARASLPTIGWQHLWLVNAAVACGLAIGFHHALPARVNATPLVIPPLSGMVVVLRDRRCALMASAFFAYSFHYFSLAFVLPLLLITTLGNSLGNAALLGAAGMGVSAVGNLMSAPLLRCGMPAWAAIGLTFVVYIVSMVGIFSGGFSTPVVALLAALALGVGGLAPGAIYSSAPRVTPTTEMLPIAVGFFQQASNLGQFAGPLVVGLTIERIGWSQVPIATVPLAVLGLGIALAIRHQLSDRNHITHDGASVTRSAMSSSSGAASIGSKPKFT